jgi:type III secretory pathway component EscS
MAAQIWGLVGNFKSALRFSTKAVHIENTAFHLFSKTTSSILLLSAGLVTLSTLIGDSIKCITPPKEDITQPHAINQYCWIMSTYTLPHLYNQTLNTDVISLGVGPNNSEEGEQKYHSYYQWVPFVLFFQGLLFMIPHVLWKAWEDGRIRAYTFLELTGSVKLKDRVLNVTHEEARNGIRRGAEYFKSCMYYNHFYSGYYIFCEILNLIIVISTIFITDSFLGNEFTTYGTEVISFVNSVDPENRVDPMDRVFPKITKCDFRKIGPSGNIIHYDVLCVLALNILNEKVYVFLWFWYIILAVIGGVALIYRLLVILLPGLRQRLILRRIPKDQQYDCRFLSRLGYSDWFLLKRISSNINTIRFGELCTAINASLEEDESRHEPSIRSGDRSPSSFTSPPPTYDSSTIPVKDDDDEKKESELFARHYPSFSLDNFGKEETEPLTTSRL